MVHSLSLSPDENENKRKAERHRTLKSGRIEVNGHSSTFDVTIRDMSESGARLVLKAVWIAPERFDLLVLNPNSGKADRHACQRAWQKGTLLGVRFID